MYKRGSKKHQSGTSSSIEKIKKIQRFFVVAALLIKAKHQHGKNHNKNTGLFINCMDFVIERTKISKK
jgi:hypothetical protein